MSDLKRLKKYVHHAYKDRDSVRRNAKGVEEWLRRLMELLHEETVRIIRDAKRVISDEGKDKLLEDLQIEIDSLSELAKFEGGGFDRISYIARSHAQELNRIKEEFGAAPTEMLNRKLMRALQGLEQDARQEFGITLRKYEEVEKSLAA